MKILVVDHQALFREGLVSMLASQSEIIVIGEAGSMQEAVEKTFEELPDIILMDLFLNDGDGLEAMKAIHARHPEIKVVFLTNHDSFDLVKTCITSGAKGFLLKSLPMSKIVVSLRAVEQGELALSRAMMSRILEEFTHFGPTANTFQIASSGLTLREVDVLKLLGVGATNREIAENLLIAENTVKIHVRKIYEKLRLRNRLDAMMFARRAGFVNNDEVLAKVRLEF